jgi:homoserine O-acetyltransferase
MGRIYAGWAMSQAFYREKLFETVGFSSLEDFLVRSWEANFLRRDAHDLLASLETWIASDISDNGIYNGDLQKALGAITARSTIMPSRTDLYFTWQDSEIETAQMPNARFQPIESIWGHRAGNPNLNADDEAVLREAVRDLLAE